MSNITGIVIFKENPVIGNLGLENYGRSKFPNCYDAIQPALGRDGRWKTGLDELAVEILAIKDSETRKDAQQSIKAERVSLEEITGFDLSGKSKYWETYFVKIDPERQLDMAVASDRIAYHVIIANKMAAPSIREGKHPEFKNSKYYVFRDYDDVSDRVERRKRQDEATVLLTDLMKTPDKAIIIGRYLELNVSNNTPQNNVYDAFRVFLDNDDKDGTVERFIAAAEMPIEDVNVKLTFDEALKLNVIRQRDGYFQRGNVTLGRDPKDALAFLKDIKNSGELLSIMDEIDVKRRFG